MARILIVEDEAVLRLTFSRFLLDEGYDVETAADFTQACTAIAAATPDVVVCDIVLPGESGIDLLRHARAECPGATVIMLTGQPEVTTAAEAVRLGAFDYLAKPVTGDGLKRVVRLALEQRRLAQERDRYAAESDRYRQVLETIFDSVSEGIIAVRPDGTIEQLNAPARAVFSLGNRTVVGRPVSEVLLPNARFALTALQESLESGRTVPEFRGEAVIAGEPGRILICASVPLHAPGNAGRGAMLTVRDITRLTRLEEAASERQAYRNIIGKSPRMLELFQLVRDLAETDSTALICGESGTGKELFAAALHEASPRKNKPFVRVNCAALSEDLLESELFGHVRGSFTGAVRDRVGRFEAANGGTILLDEIGDISPRLQLRLLRVLQEREFERVGDSEPMRVDVRVIASTNHDLRRRMEDGQFREDLYYRLNVVRLDVPALRHRGGDIALLAAHFVRRFNDELQREVVDFAPDVMALLMRYAWPGNVRELENCVERAMILCREPIIRVCHLPEEIVEDRRSHHGAPEAGFRNRERTGIDASRVRTVLEQTDWNVAKSARLLGVARNTLYQRMKVLGLSRPD